MAFPTGRRGTTRTLPANAATTAAQDEKRSSGFFARAFARAAFTTDEAVEVMRAEKKSGKILSIGFQPRFDENMKMVKKYQYIE